MADTDTKSKFIVGVLNPDLRHHFQIVEQVTWHWGTWAGDADHLVFSTKKGGGGALRFYHRERKTLPFEENFVVVIGIDDDNESWCDIVKDLADDETAASILVTYYKHGTREYIRKMHKDDYSVTDKIKTTCTIGLKHLGFGYENKIVGGISFGGKPFPFA